MRAELSAPVDAALAFSPSRPVRAVVRDYLSLTKPRLSSLVLFTVAGGMGLAGVSLPWQTWVAAMLGTAGTIGSANAFNCYLERASDAFMMRTAVRPLPAGRMLPANALVFAWVLCVVSLPVLAYGVNPLTALLGLLALVSYVLWYTPLKSRSHWAMVAGAVPGALPPLMGWTAATGRVEAPGVALFAILFFWQLPHFLAIALFRKEEYRAAGLKSVPLALGDEVARFQAVGYLAALVACSVLPYFVHVAGLVYLAASLALGAWFVWTCVGSWRHRTRVSWARRLFGVSLAYLVGLFVALAVNRLV